MSTRSTRSSISPFRSRRGPPPSNGRPTTPSSATSSGRPATPLTGARPTTPSSVQSYSSRPPSRISPVSSSNNVSPPMGSMAPDLANAKENIMVTVRFRPLSAREINKGDEIAWYADGDHTVRSESNPNIAYGFDKVFGPATTTRHVYDTAAQHVVRGAMEGINGTVFAYGVTSSGKTHTMHGEQKSPGIIPLAVKDVFSIIQDTPGREFLLRVSYLEIYNEVINDLLDPTGQNLRIREDVQGTYVEGIKEEVVLSPAHALSLIASGEEHRHVGSNNFNLVSSRSHTIFTLTVESSPSGGDDDGEEIKLSQLNLIDLAGSESSKTETTGLRRKEGSFINKSLLTLGTVIAKLTDGKSSHIPYRDSKLTRLLQSSLSGHGRISLICTVTPASSNSEETHNTLKFAHRSKHVEIKASANKILDEKSLIKKYQKEITFLKEELQQLKRGMMENSFMGIPTSQEDLVNLKLQLEAGQVKLQSRLEEEEEAKAALMGRIQRLTKLILVSTKSSISSNTSGKPGHRRRHSFGEDELAYLPDRRRDYLLDDDVGSLDSSEFSLEGKLDSNNLDDPNSRIDKRNRKRGMLSWLKMKKAEQIAGDSESSTSGSPSVHQTSSAQQKQLSFDLRDGRRRSVTGRKGEELSSLAGRSFPESTQAGDLFSVAAKGRRPPPSGTTMVDQMDLLHEQVKMLAGDIALCTSSLKRLTEQASNNPDDKQIQEQVKKLKNEINEKKMQMHVLEQRIVGSLEDTELTSSIEMSQTLSKLTAQLSEKTFELEIMSADNRILQDQLQGKAAENKELQETVTLLRQELDNLTNKIKSDKEACRNTGISNEDTKDASLKSQVLMQAAEIESLKQENHRLSEEKDGLEIHSQKLAEESTYAKELAAAAAIELKNLAEEVTRLSYENAKLTSAKEHPGKGAACKKETEAETEILVEELQRELVASCQREAALEGELSEKMKREGDILKVVEEAKRREQELENELANMWVLVAQLRKNGNGNGNVAGKVSEFESRSKLNGFHYSDREGCDSLEEATRATYEAERKRCQELEAIISRLKGEDLSGLDGNALDELQSFHVEALSKICQEKMSNRVL
ncbi:P-loop containing nucleoside triphosphate hydrolases superfamily protein [Rhynchospora pubera]|uniref:P-loop containing nucleoside triphosphate hydrolases superfamily protein n=1 Tax=Rhynchospora pubera TaxID=906938 RepID=A0AAV8D070_9POAL|nr:P-loop containing nucleoside triphosphate hydrolases superfamily protein [Rhynchospora pubera]